MANLDAMVNDYVGRARAAADPVPVLREAANRFGRAAMSPQNAHLSARLNDVAMGFARAARAAPRRATVSDFVDLLEETKAAIAEVGDHNAMDIIARRREIHDERSTDAPRVSISPSSFNEDATLGRSAKIKFAPTQDDLNNGIVSSQTVAFWQGVKKEAQAITVDVGLVSPPPPDVLNNNVLLINPWNVRPYAEIVYGSDGNKTTVKCDIGNGTRLTIVGNYVSVLVGCDPPFGSPLAPFPTADITVGASLGAFAAPSQAPVICTVYVDQLAPGTTSDFIAIPTKAVRLLPFFTNLALAETASLAFFGYGGGTTPLNGLFYKQVENFVMSPFPTGGDLSFFKIHNGGAGLANFRLPFQLSL